MKILDVGFSGFVGSNAFEYFKDSGHEVFGIDNFSRKGSIENFKRLFGKYDLVDGTDYFTADVVDNVELEKVIEKVQPDVIIHLAAQTAVTTSIEIPRYDFMNNAYGTLNVLEAVRKIVPNCIVIYSSTNKVYGSLDNEEIELKDDMWDFVYTKGIDENAPLDFHSPYGCCYSEDTDILTDSGWKRFYELSDTDRVLTYNLETKKSEFQFPTKHFKYDYEGNMYMQTGRRIQTCVTPNHKMLVSWDCNHDELENPKLLEARDIFGQPRAYLLGADYDYKDEKTKDFILPAIEKLGKGKHKFEEKIINMNDWLKFLGWYIAEGHIYYNENNDQYTVTLSSYYRKEEAAEVIKNIGFTPSISRHHISTTSKQLYLYLKQFGKSYDKFIPKQIIRLHPDQLLILLKALLDGDGNVTSKNCWRYTTISKQLADDVQEIAIRCGMSANLEKDKEGFYRVKICTTRTTQCNLGENNSNWIGYKGKVYCVEVPNGVVMVRQFGNAYFSGNSKGTADQYVRDYARIYNLRTVVFRQSCIYGEWQNGSLDQGWVSWITASAIMGKKIQIFGDGKQVRDILYVTDLINAYDMAIKRINNNKGQIFNIGGGFENKLSINQLVTYLERMENKKLEVEYLPERAGDQKIFVSNNDKARFQLFWEPLINKDYGLDKIYNWTRNHIDLWK